jgi:DNA-binding Lrp family transcriptional regulator
MVTAFILMNVETGRLRTLAEELLEIKGIAEVYSVAGEWDLVAIVRVREQEALSDLITEQIAGLRGIRKTQTLIAFRAFSKRDIAAMWDIGVD